MKSKPKRTKSKELKIRKTDGLIPPDGQYGWIIVISYAIANVKKQTLIIIIYLTLHFECF